MHSMETKIFNLDGQKLRFDARTFEYSFRAYAQDSKMKKKDLEELLAEKVGVSREAVHNWRFAKNGPSDIEMIQKLAEVLNCQTADCGRRKPHFDFGGNTSPIVPYRHLPQTLRGLTADCRSLV